MMSKINSQAPPNQSYAMGTDNWSEEERKAWVNKDNVNKDMARKTLERQNMAIQSNLPESWNIDVSRVSRVMT